MDNKAYVSSMTFVIVLLLYLRFGTLAFWVIGVTGFLFAIFAMIIETSLHIILKENSFQNYRKLKRKVFKGAFFDFKSTEFCEKNKISEEKLLVVLVLFFIGIISLIYAII